MASFIYIERGGGGDLFIIQQFVERALIADKCFPKKSSDYLSLTGIDFNLVFLSDSHSHWLDSEMYD